jgi:deoxyribonuclease (pyrimidine dimer)
MTRINVGVHPSELPSQLLLAEHREITRIPNFVLSGRAKFDKIPKEFTLNEGHVRFFYQRLYYLKRRYTALLAECRKRGFNVTSKMNSFPFRHPDDCGLWVKRGEDMFKVNYDYKPTLADRQLIIERITSKGFSLLPTENYSEVSPS